MATYTIDRYRALRTENVVLAREAIRCLGHHERRDFYREIAMANIKALCETEFRSENALKRGAGDANRKTQATNSGTAIALLPANAVETIVEQCTALGQRRARSLLVRDGLPPEVVYAIDTAFEQIILRHLGVPHLYGLRALAMMLFNMGVDRDAAKDEMTYVNAYAARLQLEEITGMRSTLPVAYRIFIRFGADMEVVVAFAEYVDYCGGVTRTKIKAGSGKKERSYPNWLKMLDNYIKEGVAGVVVPVDVQIQRTLSLRMLDADHVYEKEPGCVDE